MKRTILTTAAIFAALMFVANVDAQTTKYFYHESGSQPWSCSTCWYTDPDTHDAGTRTTEPNSADPAVIQANCYLDTSGEECASFEIEDGVYLELRYDTTGYTLEVNANSSSSIGSGSEVRLSDNSSVLRFKDSHTISGSSGKIVGSDDSAQIQIGSSNSDKTLTSETNIEGQLQILPGPSASTTTFTNNGWVRANAAGTLAVATHTISDASDSCITRWEASTNGYAVLQFATDPNVPLGSRVRIDDGGTLDINVNVTVPALIFNTGFIDVASGATFMLDPS